MALSQENRIWVNHAPQEKVKVGRRYVEEVDAVLVTVRDSAGFEKLHDSRKTTVFLEQKTDLYHGDSSNRGNVQNTTPIQLRPIIINDQNASEATPAGLVQINESVDTDPASLVLHGEELRDKGFEGYFVDAQNESPASIRHEQVIFNLRIVDKIISSPRRDLLMFLWKNTNGEIKITHFKIGGIRKRGLLTEKEVKQKTPNFSQR